MHLEYMEYTRSSTFLAKLTAGQRLERLRVGHPPRPPARRDGLLATDQAPAAWVLIGVLERVHSGHRKKNDVYIITSECEETRFKCM